MRPFFLNQIEKLLRLEKLLLVLITMLVLALITAFSSSLRAWIQYLHLQPTITALVVVVLATLISAGLIHYRSSSWLHWLYRLVESIPDLVLIADATGKLVYANDVAQRLLGYSSKELLQLALRELFIEGELPQFGEAHLRTKTMALIPVIVSVNEVKVAGTKLLVATAKDISKEVEQREMQKKLNKRLEAICHVVSTLSELTDLDAILERGLEVTMETFDAPVGRIYMLDEDGTLRLVKYKGMSEEFAEAVKNLDYGVGNVGTVAKTLKPSFVNYLTSTSKHRDLFIREGLRCSAFAPMKAHNTVYGVIALSYREKIDWTEDELSTFEAIGNELGIAIQRSKLFDEVRASCERLRRVNEHLEELVEEHTARFRALYELAQSAQMFDDIRDILNKVTAVAYDMLPCSVFGVLTNFDENPLISLVASQRVSDEAVNIFATQLVLSYERTANEKVDLARVKINIVRSGDGRDGLGELGIQTWALQVGEDVIGTIGIACSVHQQLDEDDREFLLSLIEQVEVILGNKISCKLEEKARFVTALEALGEGILITDRDANIIAITSVAKDILSTISKDEKEALKAIKVDELIRKVSEKEQVLTSEATHNGKWYSIRLSRWLPEGEWKQLYVVSIRDITEQKMQEMEITLTQRLASIGELASGVAHEINNPLTTIIGYAELQLEQGNLPDEVRGDLMKIYNAGLRARDITHKLLSFSRGMSEHTEPKVIDLQAVVDQALELIASQLAVVGIKLEREYEERMPAVVANQAVIQQIVLNLVLNSKDAIELSGKGSRVTVRLHRVDEKHIAIEVEDDGPGIPPDTLGRIFDPFFTTKPVGRGTGLGLSIVHKYVKEMGGKINVWSEEGKGTKFEVILPIAHEHAATQNEKEESAPPSHRGGKVLIIDDEASICSLIEQALTKHGYEVASTTDPREALKLVDENFFDVILLDIRMPHINGIRLYEMLKERSPEQAKRVVFLTGDILSSLTLEAQNVGVPILLKPLTCDELVAFLQEHSWRLRQVGTR
jgi:PAS domain S-box-containing protein